MTRNILVLFTAAFAVALSAPALADGPVAERSAEKEREAFKADRESILAMAGNYKVRFDMQEATPWRLGYEPLKRKISGGNETVIVVEGTGRKIVLQHILVVSHKGKDHIVKHWRQDWEYEPESILVYAGPGRWVKQSVPEKMRRGRWSQTVYQVDDSPRYAGWGRWEWTNGVRRWRSNWTVRPLARRDAVRKPVYDRYNAINRHQLTPTGWIHWQDNTKMDEVDGEFKPVVQEYVLNTYSRSDDYNVSAATTYWGKTKDYWQAVRAAWDDVLVRTGGISIAEEAQTGTVISGKLLKIGDEIAAGKKSADVATREAQALIRAATSARPADG